VGGVSLNTQQFLPPCHEAVKIQRNFLLLGDHATQTERGQVGVYYGIVGGAASQVRTLVWKNCFKEDCKNLKRENLNQNRGFVTILFFVLFLLLNSNFSALKIFNLHKNNVN